MDFSTNNDRRLSSRGNQDACSLTTSAISTPHFAHSGWESAVEQEQSHPSYILQSLDQKLRSQREIAAKDSIIHPVQLPEDKLYPRTLQEVNSLLNLPVRGPRILMRPRTSPFCCEYQEFLKGALKTPIEDDTSMERFSLLQKMETPNHTNSLSYKVSHNHGPQDRATQQQEANGSLLPIHEALSPINQKNSNFDFPIYDKAHIANDRNMLSLNMEDCELRDERKKSASRRIHLKPKRQPLKSILQPELFSSNIAPNVKVDTSVLAAPKFEPIKQPVSRLFDNNAPTLPIMFTEKGEKKKVITSLPEHTLRCIPNICATTSPRCSEGNTKFILKKRPHSFFI